jgi:uncharacterized protein (DUF58 family)
VSTQARPSPAAPPLAREELFDAAFFQQLRSLALRLRKRRQLQRRGAQSSPATGQTREFKDYRHYTSGEDYRAIDWRLYARLDKLFLRLFEETQELHLHLLLDTSASMVAPHVEKRKQSLRFAVALAYLGLSSQQRVSLYSMADGVKAELPPLRGLAGVEQLIECLCQLRYTGVADLQKCFSDFHPSRRQPGIFFILSDFYGRELGSAAAALGTAASWPGEVHLVQIHHPA